MVKDAVRPVRELYGRSPAIQFGPLALAAVREAMVGKGWCRPYVNRQVTKVVRAFKWAAGRELVPAALFTALKTLEPLKRGRTAAPEPPPREAADPAAVDATLPHLPAHVRGIIELIRLTGARPSEVCRMALGKIDRSGPVWVYRPKKHKNEHRGKSRAILLGPAAQAIIVAQLGGKVLGSDEPLFSPRRQRDERFTTLRAKRKTKVPPSQVARKKSKPKRVPGEWFTYHVLGHAVNVAARKAGVKPWTPYMLRHLRAAEVRTQFGMEHAKAVLGHPALEMTEHYAKSADAALAAEVAQKTG